MQRGLSHLRNLNRKLFTYSIYVMKVLLLRSIRLSHNREEYELYFCGFRKWRCFCWSLFRFVTYQKVHITVCFFFLVHMVHLLQNSNDICICLYRHIHTYMHICMKYHANISSIIDHISNTTNIIIHSIIIAVINDDKYFIVTTHYAL